MAFIAPIIGAALGLGAVGTAIVGAGVSLGLGLLSRRLMPQPETSAYGMSLQLRMEANDPREICFGRVATAGSLEAHNVYGPNGNDYVQLVFALADHECDGLESFLYVDGVKCTIGASASTSWVTGNSVAGYAGSMWVQFYSGAWGQTADPDLVARVRNGEWTANDRGRGICYARVTLKYDAQKFKGGLPRFLFVLRGAKLYDWRKDSTNGGSGAHRWNNPSTFEWSENPAVILYNYLRGVSVNGVRLGGMNVAPSSLPVANWSAAANACDEAVARKVGGNEKRYTCHCIIRIGTAHRDIVRDMLATMAGSLVDSGGVFRLLAGVAQSSVMTINDENLMARDALQVVPKLSRSAIVNAVFGTFSDPEQAYEAVALPPRLSSADEAADGGVHIPEHYGLGFVTSGTQAQRVCEIFRRRARRQMRVSCRLSSRYCVLEPGDWVTWSSVRLGYVNITMEVVQVTLNRDLTVDVELRETAAAVYSWSAATDELDPAAPVEVNPGGATLLQVGGWSVANVNVVGGAASVTRPGLRATWTPIDDLSVNQIRIEYRRVGDATALERIVTQPFSGSYTWVDGVQGGTQYEARAIPVTNPARATSWTGWGQTGGNTGGQAVAVAVTAITATSVPPDTITPDMLSQQSRLELSLATATEAIQGSVNERLNTLREDLERVSQSVIGTIGRQDRLMRSVRSQVDGNTASVIELLEATDGLSGSWTIAVDINNRVLGAVRLDGSESTSQFTILADRLVVASPGNPDIVPFVITPSGIFLEGAVVKDGTITVQKLNVSQLSAISANLGTVAAGQLQSPDASSFWNLNTGDFQIS